MGADGGQKNSRASSYAAARFADRVGRNGVRGAAEGVWHADLMGHGVVMRMACSTLAFAERRCGACLQFCAYGYSWVFYSIVIGLRSVVGALL